VLDPACHGTALETFGCFFFCFVFCFLFFFF
jgi:hypothetical protein